MSHRTLFVVLFAAALVAACSEGQPSSPTQPTVLGSGADARGPAPQFAIDTYVDYGMPSKVSDALIATTETDSFSLIQGGLHWNTGDPVEYWIRGPEGVTGGNAAAESGVNTIDGYVIPRTFTRLFAEPADNPCGIKNEILWTSIDGPGSVLAATSTCRNVATKEIVGFRIIIDTDDEWSVGGSSTTFDVQNIITHEMGHAAGLGHDSSPRDGCLTMYKYADYGETGKRTLGLGDKLGMKKLYNSSDVTAGTCGS